jgi:peptide deformylase
MIIINDESALRVDCEDVKEHEVSELIEILQAQLVGTDGVGLAAPQIGLAKKIAIVRTPNVNINLVNAKIEKAFDKKRFEQEGCLSFPNKTENTLRYQEVYITNNLVYPHNFIATGMSAIICQHEIDHLNKILFMDHKAPEIIMPKIKIGPNDRCFCGSGKKFKKCCQKGK